MEHTQTRSWDSSVSLHKRSLHFPDGLPAFEAIKAFTLIANEEEEPFLWLQATDRPALAFVCIDPFLVYPEYRPDICDDDVNALEITTEEEAFLLSIVNIHNPNGQGVTANLVSPVVINWEKGIGKQVILQNHRNFSVKYRIDQPENEQTH